MVTRKKGDYVVAVVIEMYLPQVPVHPEGFLTVALPGIF
jgi:hypothetical protein